MSIWRSLKNDKRFELMKENFPQLHSYCMEKLGLREVLNFIKNGEKKMAVKTIYLTNENPKKIEKLEDCKI